MGDVAILMKNSFNSMQTILCNGIINLISIAGVLIGLLIIDMSELVKVYILVFVAGNFFYIAADIWRHMFRNHGVWRNAIEMAGFALGIGVIYALLFMEGGCGHHGHSHGHGHSHKEKISSTE
jgi:zinc transporter ZupT